MKSIVRLEYLGRALLLAAALLPLLLTACGGSAVFDQAAVAGNPGGGVSTPQGVGGNNPGSGGTSPGGGVTPPGDGGNPPGGGTTYENVYDLFQQPASGEVARPADVIFVVDTSPSMIIERDALAKNIDRLLNALKDAPDYRVAVMAAHSRSEYAGEPLAAPGNNRVLYPGLYSRGGSDACRDLAKRYPADYQGVDTLDPFQQLKCEFRENMEQADEERKGVAEIYLSKTPFFSLPDDPYTLVDADPASLTYGQELSYGDPEASAKCLYRPQGEFGLRSLETAVSGKLAQNQSGQDPNGAPYEPILRPQASWNFVWMSDENDACIKQDFYRGKWYASAWDPADNSYWAEAYGNRDFCASSITPESRVTPALLIEELQNIRGRLPFGFYAFGYFDLPGYSPPQIPAIQDSYSLGYWGATETLGGLLIDLAKKDEYPKAMEDVGSKVNQQNNLQQVFCLTRDPAQPEQVKCLVDGLASTCTLIHDVNACPDSPDNAGVRLTNLGTYNSEIRIEYTIVIS